MSKLYVGNLPFSVTSTDLEGLFTPHGPVASVNVIMDRDTGQSRGYGFVEMGDKAHAQAAMTALNGHSLEGRSLIVNEAKPKTNTAGTGFRSGPRRAW